VFLPLPQFSHGEEKRETKDFPERRSTAHLTFSSHINDQKLSHTVGDFRTAEIRSVNSEA
jgi:hypothetical protein